MSEIKRIEADYYWTDSTIIEAGDYYLCRVLYGK